LRGRRKGARLAASRSFGRRTINWLSTLGKHVDYLSGRYQAYPVRDEASRAGVLRVLDEVRRNELKRVHGSSTLESAAFVDAEVSDQLYAIKDTRKGEIIGCVRLTMADQLAAIANSRQEYRLDIFPPELLRRTHVYTRLAILRDYRKTAASLVLLRRLYQDALGGDTLASLLSCEPGLYAGYLRMGFRPLGGVHQAATGGFRIPMVAILHDGEHMRKVRSPLLPLFEAFDGPKPTDALRWYRALEAREGPIDPGVAFYADDEANDAHAQLTRDLSDAGRAELLHNAIEVDCRPGDVLLSLGDGGRNMGFVLRGAVQAQIGDRVVALLGEGELFGEVALALDATRIATLIAAGDDTRVLLLSQTCIDRLSQPGDRARLWRNIARVLATKLRRLHE
jgi:Cyclic nucleotide-binding domain/Acetyltransferase (GNAT) domain